MCLAYGGKKLIHRTSMPSLNSATDYNKNILCSENINLFTENNFADTTDYENDQLIFLPPKYIWIFQLAS